ncbi:MAG: SDR family oxidoreductase [Anaerolineales bacterium]|uniref:SDR family oxidoreductase n=1 Tax=Candidatus Desulfolinea nitratireducens TaxID=2841698 RepID=A0A8J6NJS5_9CHLR|nr:SDR family oxidoreductase [Candidatus Desulfolinea nitratireducens]MBL6960452.1 SDR family oxidoreductase [Anaerolineales bacterium]
MTRVVVTGANRGLGLELVLQCVQRGDQVFAGCRSPEKASSLEEISTKYPGQVTMLPLEVSDNESIAQCAVKVAAKIDGLDLLFNNAAIHMGDEHLSEVKAETLLKTTHVNAVGAVLVAQAFINLLKKGTDPKLINVSSEAGSIGGMGDFRGYNYYGSKAAMNMYTRSLAWDPETEGVTVIAIHPGWVRTDMGGSEAHLSTAESAEGLLQVADGLAPEDNGKFYTWEGHEYPW